MTDREKLAMEWSDERWARVNREPSRPHVVNLMIDAHLAGQAAEAERAKEKLINVTKTDNVTIISSLKSDLERMAVHAVGVNADIAALKLENDRLFSRVSSLENAFLDAMLALKSSNPSRYAEVETKHRTSLFQTKVEKDG